MGEAVFSPSEPMGSSSKVFDEYLCYYRRVVTEAVHALSEEDQRSSHLASGWTPLELVSHLNYMERRWLEWGFLGRDVSEPWGDWRDGRWFTDGATSDELLEALDERGRFTSSVISSHALTECAAPGPRFKDDEPSPTLERILFHMLQEYARHAGHLDIVVEVAGQST